MMSPVSAAADQIPKTVLQDINDYTEDRMVLERSVARHIHYSDIYKVTKTCELRGDPSL